ncbi:MAG: cation diffusion facilitator family transporter [Oceanidesulfovibrio sp.]
MAHDHAHHGPAAYDKRFALGIALNIIFVVVEVLYGFAADSMALLADAGHNLSDVLSLVLAWAASALARKQPSRKRTYGMGRSTIYASLANAALLLVAVGAITMEAVERFQHPVAVSTSIVIWVAAVGTVINTATALLFMSGSKHDLNIRGAFLHMAADAGVSLGVVVAALVIAMTGALWIDPLMSLFIVAVIAVGTWGLFRESLDLAMDAVPRGIDLESVERYLLELPGVIAYHDLHVWPLSTTSTALTVHLVRPESDRVAAGFLHQVGDELRERFGIDHATIQLETDESRCTLHGACVFRKETTK